MHAFLLVRPTLFRYVVIMQDFYIQLSIKNYALIATFV
jgi:hypothetical protein